MLTKLLQGRSHVWSGALISAGIIMLFWLALAPSTSAHERLLKTETKFLAEHEDFVGAEPPVCDILDFDGPLKGEIFGETTSNSAEIRVTFDQFGCQIVGTLEILSTRFAGTGPFYGNIDGNYIRFTVTSETSDAPRDLNFGGLLDGDRIKGQYSIPHTDFVSEWHLSTGNSGPIARLTDLKDSVMDSGLIGEIRELEDELADLREREAELSSELELQFEAESVEIIDRWESEIDELEAEVDHEIALETERINLEKLRVTSRLGRNTVVVDLDRELELIVDEKWAWFDEQAALKLELMEEELNKLEITKASQLGRLSRMILTLESTLDEKLKASGITSDQVESQTTDASQGLPVATLSDKPESTAVIIDDSAEKTGAPASPSKETAPEESRGFFFNSESGALGDLGESLDPTTLAVLGILITLAATAIQLVKGN